MSVLAWAMGAVGSLVDTSMRLVEQIETLKAENERLRHGVDEALDHFYVQNLADNPNQDFNTGVAILEGLSAK